MATILVVEDDPRIAGLLQEMLRLEGYEAIVTHTGEDAIHLALRGMPHLIILDLMLPGINGYEVVQALRSHVKTAHIPVIILSALDGTADIVRAFDHQADDYVSKPFKNDELLARIRTQLRRMKENLLHPLTGLPGGVQVERAIESLLQQSAPWSLLYLDLNNFKAYNDVYGFLSGNRMIQMLAQICVRMVKEMGNEADFIGHVGGDDFVVATTPDRVEPMCTALIQAFEREQRVLYSEEDLRRGALITTDRQGTPGQYPLVGLAIGVVTNQYRPLASIEEVSRVAAEVKKKAKESERSAYYIDQRGLPFQVLPEYHRAPTSEDLS